LPAAGELAGRDGTAGPDSNVEPLGILVLAGVRIMCIRRVEEETSAPHSRLAYIHLLISSALLRSDLPTTLSARPEYRSLSQE